MSDFLKKLKDAVETGDFNSEAAKKINEIDELANRKSYDDAEKSIEKRVEDSGIKNIDESKIAEINSEYEKKMAEIKEKEFINKQIALLLDFEHELDLSIGDFKDFILQLKNDFNENEDKTKEMFDEIKRLTNKYNINN